MNDYLITGHGRYDKPGRTRRYWTGIRWDDDLFNARAYPSEADAEKVVTDLRALGATAEIDRSRER